AHPMKGCSGKAGFHPTIKTVGFQLEINVKWGLEMTPYIGIEERFSGKSVMLQLLQPRYTKAYHQFRNENRPFFTPFEGLKDDASFTLASHQAAVQQSVEEADLDKAYGFGIFLRASGTLIGTIRLSMISRGVFQNAYLGYSMAEKYNGHGFMTEAVNLCLNVAFGALKLHRVQANVMPRNLASQRVLEKNGFTREGYSRNYLKINGKWEDHINFAILAEDYQK
ncbi:GNAT family protein, partial [Paenibacillus larvae]